MTGNNIAADTNIIIEIMKGEESFVNKLESFDVVYLSPVVIAELFFGAYRSANPQKHLSKIADAINKTIALKIDTATAEIFVKIKLALLSKGKPIPENDIWIAASAIQHKLPLYTNDDHFTEIDSLTIVGKVN